MALALTACATVINNHLYLFGGLRQLARGESRKFERETVQGTLGTKILEAVGLWRHCEMQDCSNKNLFTS